MLHNDCEWIGTDADCCYGLYDSYTWQQLDGLVQDCGNSSALAMVLLQSYVKPSS